MKRFAWAVLLAALAFNLEGCLTYRWRVEEPTLTTAPPKPDQPALIETPAVYGSRAGFGDFRIENRSTGVVYASPDRSMMEYAGRSYRLITGERRVINSDLPAPDVPIAPGSSILLGLYPADGSPIYRGVDVRYRIAISDGTSLSYLVIDTWNAPIQEDVTVATRASAGDRWGCYITGILYGGWCWFVAPDEDDEKAAKEAAATTFGFPVEKVKVRYQRRE